MSELEIQHIRFYENSGYVLQYAASNYLGEHTMHYFRKTLRCSILFFVALSVGCASLIEFRNQHYCNYEGAYAAGTNDANERRPMSGMPSMSCPEASKPDVLRGYREGYTNANRNRPAQLNINIGSSVKRDCHSSFGQEVCGYNCIQSFGKWYCGQQPTDNCVENYSNVRCGRNCHKHFGDIRCDN
jgi:hypothetical protein